jgi:hypothetical protein
MVGVVVLLAFSLYYCRVGLGGDLHVASCLSCFCGLTFARLGWVFGRRLPSDSLFGWHDVGVLSSTQTVGANVGVR